MILNYVQLSVCVTVGMGVLRVLVILDQKKNVTICSFPVNTENRLRVLK